MKSTGAAALAAVLAMWTTACTSSAPGPVVTEHHAIERGAATSARVEIEMTAGDLEMTSGSKTLFEGDFDFNVADLKPVIAYDVSGNTGALKVSQGSASGSYVNTWRLSLDEMTPVDLDVDLKAGDAKLVLGGINLRRAEILLGAGDVTVDLRGTPTQSYSVNVRAGAGDTTIHLPAAVGISAKASGLIGDVSVSGLEKRDGRWVNAKAGDSPVTINLEVQHAVGDLRLIAE